MYTDVVAARILENCNVLGNEYINTVLEKLNKLIDSYFEKELSSTNPDIE
jgi:hypothetical protein